MFLYQLLPSSNLFMCLMTKNETPRRNFVHYQKQNWARYLGGKIKSGEESNLHTTLVKREVDRNEESIAGT